MDNYEPKATPTKLKLYNIFCAERDFQQQRIDENLGIVC